MSPSNENKSTLTSVSFAGRDLKIACPANATAKSDPVSVLYREGKIDNLTSLLKVAQASLSPGDRVLDLGAHLGGFALAASSIGCEVLAVEASPGNAFLVQTSAVQNRFEKLSVVNAAVSDSPGALQFSCDGPYGYIATSARVPELHLQERSKLTTTVTVPAVKIDDLLAERGWENVRLIKLDVEGSEVRAIRGMNRLLSRPDAPLVYFESNKYTLQFYGETHENLKAEFRNLGYTIYQIESNELIETSSDSEQVEVVADYLAAKSIPERLLNELRMVRLTN